MLPCKPLSIAFGDKGKLALPCLQKTSFYLQTFLPCKIELNFKLGNSFQFVTKLKVLSGSKLYARGGPFEKKVLGWGHLSKATITLESKKKCGLIKIPFYNQLLFGRYLPWILQLLCMHDKHLS